MGLSHSPRIVTDGLVFCVDAGDKMSYPGAGTTWTDLSKNRNNGTLVNGPTFDSANGGSISLDGSNDYISVGSFNEDSSQDLSVMVWVYPIVLDGGSSSGKDYSWIINKRDNASDRQWQMYFRSIEGANDFFFRASMWDNTAGTQVSASPGGTTEIFENQWYHCVLTFNSSNSEVNLYLNGVPEASATLGGTGNRKTGARELIFCKAGWESSYFLSSNLASTQIYNRALSPEEIKQNYNATRGRFQ